MNSKSKYVVILIFALCTVAAFGHNPKLHRAMVTSASESVLESSSATHYREFLNVISSDDVLLFDATNSMANGSEFEDNKNKDDGGWRQFSHFYDPMYSDYGRGLSIAPLSIRWLVGTNSFKWASISNCPGWDFGGLNLGIYHLVGNIGAKNTNSWQNARYLEWIGLTATNKTDRAAALSGMFRDMGQVMHLLQDTTSPQHVRNEQHVPYSPWSSSIEAYGKKHVNELNYQHGFLDWRNAGFIKLVKCPISD